MKKLIFTVLVLAALGFLGWKIREKLLEAKAKEPDKGRPSREAVVPVEVTRVRKETVRDIARFTGSLKPRTQFVVAPKVGGRLEKLLVNMHDRLRRGQMIAVLDDAEYRQQVEEMRAELEVARAQMEEARSALEIGKREYERVQAMYQKGVTSEALYDSALAKFRSQDARLKVTEAQLVQKEAALKSAGIRLSYTRIAVTWEEDDAPRVVGRRFVDEGAMLRANDPIVSVLDIDTVIAVIHVIGRDYERVREGQEVRITTDDGKEKTRDRVFIGKVLRKAPSLDEKTRQAPVEVEIPNADHVLRPGYFVRAEVELDRKTNATVVPLTALTRRQKQSGVFTVDLKTLKARFVPLETGIISGKVVEVVKPELSGVVVSIGQHLLGEDTTVVIPNGVPGDEPQTQTPKTDAPKTDEPKGDQPPASPPPDPQQTPAASGVHS